MRSQHITRGTYGTRVNPVSILRKALVHRQRVVVRVMGSRKLRLHFRLLDASDSCGAPGPTLHPKSYTVPLARGIIWSVDAISINVSECTLGPFCQAVWLLLHNLGNCSGRHEDEAPCKDQVFLLCLIVAPVTPHVLSVCLHV